MKVYSSDFVFELTTRIEGCFEATYLGRLAHVFLWAIKPDMQKNDLDKCESCSSEERDDHVRWSVIAAGSIVIDVIDPFPLSSHPCP